MFNAPAWKAEKQRRAGGGDNQPCNKEIKRLEGVEANARVTSKPLRREKNDRRDHTEYRNIAKYRSCPIAHAAKEIGELGGRAGLRGAAVMTERCVGVNASSAVGAKGQVSDLLTLTF
jgi:hypothetical protein